jgi:signal transduction histidine kinase/integral membrane sensor domain MASE1
MSVKPSIPHQLSSFVVSILAYYFAGLFGLELAIPPGFASAVWPAAGIALALMVVRPGKWVVIGTFLASFILNYQLVSSNFSTPSLSLIGIPLTIATGASLQLLAGYILFKRLMGTSIVADVGRSITRFSLVVVPFSCLIAASFGTYALYANNIIVKEAAVFSWLTWWLGDSIGVLLFTPMLVIVLTKESQFKFSRKLQIVIPSVLIFTCTCLLFLWSIEARQKNIIRDINDKVDQYSQGVKERLFLSKNKLLSYQAYFQGSSHITYSEFEEFSRVLLDGDQVLQGVGWTEAVNHSDRKKVEKDIKDQGYDDFEFKEYKKNIGLVRAEDKNKYYPILYIYPYKSNEKALGLDLASLPGRLELLETIETTGAAKVTQPITLVQESENQKAIILYLPVWQRYPYNQTLKGFVSGVFRVGGVLGSILDEAEKENLGITINDITKDADPQALINSQVDSHLYFPSMVRMINFQDRKYQVIFQPSNKYEKNEKDWISWVILVGGFLISALLQSFILMITGAIEHTNNVVKIKTRQLTQAIEKAESANQAKSMFLANMSHELRTPLNAIVGLINLCLRTRITDQQEEYLYQSKLSAQTLMSLINQSLDYAKIEAGKLELENIEFNLSKIIKNIYAVFHSQAKQKEIEFILESKNDLPKYLIGDALRLEQILLNICSNALKFTEKGYVTLSVDVLSETSKEYTLAISVKDSGIGVSKEQQKTLFESFKQADNSTTRKYGGTGLGLAISKQLVELMGGNIHVVSELDQGCEFIMTIPFKKSQQVGLLNLNKITYTEDDSLLGSEESQIPEKPLQGFTILLVEDIEINRMIATELLEHYGAVVAEAFNGQHALEVLDSGAKFDVVLMDIQMPVMDGYEATKAIRQRPHLDSLPVLAMTANAMNEDIRQCEEAGMNGHISKPIDDENMVRTILSVLVKPEV